MRKIYLLLIFGFFLSIYSCQEKSQNEIDILAIVPLSGNGGPLGTYTYNGLELAVKEQNKKGGLLGRKIKLHVEDSKAEPKEGVSIIKNRMAKAQKPFLVYSIISGVTMAIRPETEKNKTILMAAVGTNKFLDGANYTIRNFFPAAQMGDEITEYLSTSTNLRNVGFFYSNNEYGNSVNESIVGKCKEKGLNLIFNSPFEERALDYKSLLAGKLSEKVECVYVAGVGKGLGTMIKQIKESGYAGKIIGDPLIPFPDVKTSAGEALKGIDYLDFAFDATTKEGKNGQFNKEFEEEFGKTPQNFSVITYDAAKVLFDIIEKNQTFDSDIIVKKMNEVKEFKGVFGNININERNFNFTFKMKQAE